MCLSVRGREGGPLSRKDAFLKQHFQLWVIHIKGGLTPVSQCLHRAQSPNRNFKMSMHDSYNEWSLIQHEDKIGKIAAPSRAQVLRWAVEAWSVVTPRMIARSAVVTGGVHGCMSHLSPFHVAATTPCPVSVLLKAANE